jgi:chromosome segregation ATPase/DNA-directed RNA polymerase subunit RPC12/RpoP
MSEPQPKFITICPRCSSALKVRRVYLGQMVACKQCNHSFVGVEVDGPIATITGSYTTESLAQLSPNEERIQVVCENCEAALSVRSSRIGQVISCKQCGREILIKVVPETHPQPALAACGSTSADDRLHRAAGRGSPDEQHEPLRSQHHEFQTELEKLRVAHNLLEIELTRLQPAYNLVKAENKRLSEQIDSQLESHRCRQSELEEQLHVERLSHQAELIRRTIGLDELSERHRAVQDRLNSAEASCDLHRRQNEELIQTQSRLESDFRSQLESHRCRQTELEAQLRVEHQNHQAELNRRTSELDALSEQHRAMQDRLTLTDTSCNEHLRRIQELVQAHSRLESDLRSQVESHRCRQTELEEQLRVERQNHQTEMIRRTAELDELSEQHRVLQDRMYATEAGWKEYQESNHELFETQAQLETALRSQLESERCRQAELEEELRALRAEIATRAETVIGNVASQPVLSDHSSNGSTRDDELETVRTEIVTLRRQFGEMERLYLQLRNGLNGLGIRVDLR